MNVIAYDPVMKNDSPAFAQVGAKPSSLDELISQADVVTLHVPLVDGTRGLFNAQRIAAMKKGSVLINTSRGHIVDVAAVAASLKSGHLGGAALDVFDTEPMPADPIFEGCPNLILTPHISGVTYEGNERVSFMIADLVLEALK
jgi:(S)-sulfolactate dehydrogenase